MVLKKQSLCPSTDKENKMWKSYVYTCRRTHTNTMKYYSVFKKEINSVMCDNIDEFERYCKWNKPGIGSQLLDDSAYI